MSHRPIDQTPRQAAAAGLLAGLAASTVQSAIGFFIDRALLPTRHDNNIAPRLVHRSSRRVGYRSSPAQDWLLGVLFHFFYGAGWGALYGPVRAHLRAPRLALGGALGGLLYLLAFSRIGLGTRTGTEEPPDRRPLHKQLALVAVAFTDASALARLYDPIARWLGARRQADGLPGPATQVGQAAACPGSGRPRRSG